MLDEKDMPVITPTTEERKLYERQTAQLLRKTMEAFDECDGDVIAEEEGGEFQLIRKTKNLSAYRSIEFTTAKTTSLVATGTLTASLNDIMESLYFETTDQLRSTLLLLQVRLVDAAVLHVQQTQSTNRSFNFAGITWLASKSKWAIGKSARDTLVYHTMGITKDSKGRELGFLVLHSIERNEWMAEPSSGLKQTPIRSCSLFRQQNNTTKVYMKCPSLDVGSSELWLADLWLCMGNVMSSLDARRLMHLVNTAHEHSMPSSEVCEMCHSKKNILDKHFDCTGCHRRVCRSCSRVRPIFKLERSSSKLSQVRFCEICITDAGVQSASSYSESVSKASATNSTTEDWMNAKGSQGQNVERVPSVKTGRAKSASHDLTAQSSDNASFFQSHASKKGKELLTFARARVKSAKESWKSPWSPAINSKLSTPQHPIDSAVKDKTQSKNPGTPPPLPSPDKVKGFIPTTKKDFVAATDMPKEISTQLDMQTDAVEMHPCLDDEVDPSTQMTFMENAAEKENVLQDVVNVAEVVEVVEVVEAEDEQVSIAKVVEVAKEKDEKPESEETHTDQSMPLSRRRSMRKKMRVPLSREGFLDDLYASS